MRKMNKKFLSIFLTFAMVVTMIPAFSITAAATTTTDVTYIDANRAETSCPVATVVTGSEEPITWDAGWYVVNSDVTISDRITCNGEVHLILEDGKTLKASKGITCNESNSFIVYGQSGGTGTLIATGNTSSAGIGGESNSNGSNITINGGKVIATGGTCSAGIGGGSNGDGTNITINGGTVNATGRTSSAGIGGGSNGDGTDIIINGGIVTATGGIVAAGIGGGANGDGTNITINGGTVIAHGGPRCIGGGSNMIGSNIFVGDDIVVMAGNSENPTVVIPHASPSTDISSLLVVTHYIVAKEQTSVAFVDLNGNGSFDEATETKYVSVQEAINAATDGQAIILLKDVALNQTVEFDSINSVNIDLNGHNITAINCRALYLKSGSIDITGKGNITSIHTSGNTSFKRISSVIHVGADEAVDGEAKLTIGEDVTVETDYCYGITAFGNQTAENVTVLGTVITAGMPALCGDGADVETGATFNVRGTKNKSAVVTSTGSTAIYCPQFSILNNLNASYAKITGVTGIELRAGSAAISNSTITATGTYKVKDSNNDTTTNGAAIAIAQHKTKLDVVLTVTGANTISGGEKGVAVSVTNPQNNDSSNVKIFLNGGTYTGGIVVKGDKNYLIRKGASVELAAPEGYYWKKGTTDTKPMTLTAKTTPETPTSASYTVDPTTLKLSLTDSGVAYEYAVKPASGDPVWADVVSGTTQLEKNTIYLLRVKATDSTNASEALEFNVKRDVTITATMADVAWTGNAVTGPTEYKVMCGEEDVTANVYQNLDFDYYDMTAPATKLSGAPTDVGYYKLVISVKDSYIDYSGSATYYFAINPVINNVDGTAGIKTTTNYFPTYQGDLELHSSAELEDFIKVTVTKPGASEAEEVANTNYDVGDGSIKVTLKETYLKNLAAGTYVFHIISGINTGTKDAPVWLQKDEKNIEFSADISVVISNGCKYTVNLCKGENIMLLLGGKEAGTFTIIGDAYKGFKLQTAEGKYLTFENGELKTDSTNSNFTWKYDGGLYAETKSSTKNRGIFWYFAPTKVTKHYLAFNGEELVISNTKVSAGVQVMAETHAYRYFQVGNDKHQAICTKCGHKEDAVLHKYESDTHKCVCGKFDPDLSKVTGVNVTKKEIKVSSGYWYRAKKVTKYQYTIAPVALNVKVAKVQYSMNGKNGWKTGSVFTSDSELTVFYIKVTDSKGSVSNWKWNGTTAEPLTEN